MISSERKAKISQMKNPVPARLSLGAGILLHLALKEMGYSHVMEDISYGENGKPYLKGTDIHFNLSHSGEYAVCAYGDMPVGIDLQFIKETIPKHTKKILSEEEMQYLSSLNDKDKVKAFYILWAKKESLIKLDGRGLKIPLHNTSMVNNDYCKVQIQFETSFVHIKELDFLMPEYAAAISTKNEIVVDKILEITSDFLINY